MSAYMVDREHIDALVQLALFGPTNRHSRQYPGGGWRSRGHGLHWWTVDDATLPYLAAASVDVVRRQAGPPDPIGAMLVAENLASIHHRYPDTRQGGTIPGPAVPYWDEPYIFRPTQPAPTAVEGLKLIDSYEYQSCEHPEWPASEAQSFCHALRVGLVQELDGYAAAPWGWPALVEEWA